MTIVVTGLGLIGGSFALAAHRAGHDVSGVDVNVPADAPFPVETPARADARIARADLVFVALPPSSVVPWIRAHAPGFKRGALVVDATGVKGTVCGQLREFAFSDRWTFIGGHPMAGREVNGFANATADLFRGASMILTPYPTCPRGPLETLTALFAALGFARTVITTPERHDRMIALTSQLAHVVSSAYVRDPLAVEHGGFSAGSFHDMTRVARLDPKTWTDLFLANRAALSGALGGLVARLQAYRDALDAGDAATLEALLAAGRDARLKCSRIPEKTPCANS